MKKFTFISLFFWMTITIIIPFKCLAQPPQEVLDKYEPHNYLYNYKTVDLELAYRLMRPINFDASKKYPVIITLHGGTAFRKPEEKLKYNIYTLQEYNEQLAIDSIRLAHPTYVLAPQGKSDLFWLTEDFVGIKGIIATLPSVDFNRIYIMGTSAGGNGTHNFISAEPGYFTAAITSASNPDKIDPTKRANLVNFNLWHLIGNADLEQNRYPGSVAFFDDMKSRNARMKLTTFFKAGHGIGSTIIGNKKIYDTYRNGYQTEIAGTDSDPESDNMDWLFSKSKITTALETINNNKTGISIVFDQTNSKVSLNSTSNIVKVEVYSLTGTKLMQITQQAINSIDLSSLNNGMYILHFYPQNQAAFTKKVMKTSR